VVYILSSFMNDRFMGVEYFVIFYHKHVHTKHVFFWLHSMLTGNASSVGPIKKEEIPNVNCVVRFHDFLFGHVFILTISNFIYIFLLSLLSPTNILNWKCIHNYFF
jgi:hypothetical protein